MGQIVRYHEPIKTDWRSLAQNNNDSGSDSMKNATKSSGRFWRRFIRWMLKNQLHLAFNLLELVFFAHLVPKARPYTTKLFTLSYKNDDTGKYGHGIDDSYLIIGFIILFTALRAAVMKYLLQPFAKMWGVRKMKDLTRFSEQSWMLCYYTVSWTLGMYIYSTSSYWLDMRELWTEWPRRELTGLVKFYILAQWGFWLQQIIVIHTEERRKDHWQMLAHHIVTCSLIHACYAYHQTRVGNLILVTMDFVDIVLPLAKCLKYLGFKTVCDIAFGIFVVSWVLTRHIFYSMVCWSIYADIPDIIGESCWIGSAQDLQGPIPKPQSPLHLFEPFWDAKGLVCFGHTQKWAFLLPLLALQCMNVVWFAMIARVALRVIRREGAEDSRSGDEGDEGEPQGTPMEECRRKEGHLPIGNVS